MAAPELREPPAGLRAACNEPLEKSGCAATLAQQRARERDFDIFPLVGACGDDMVYGVPRRIHRWRLHLRRIGVAPLILVGLQRHSGVLQPNELLHLQRPSHLPWQDLWRRRTPAVVQDSPAPGSRDVVAHRPAMRLGVTTSSGLDQATTHSGRCLLSEADGLPGSLGATFPWLDEPSVIPPRTRRRLRKRSRVRGTTDMVAHVGQ
jgi:hypothetical protein